jgi:hypothetical protein
MSSHDVYIQLEECNIPNRDLLSGHQLFVSNIALYERSASTLMSKTNALIVRVKVGYVPEITDIAANR